MTRPLAQIEHELKEAQQQRGYINEAYSHKEYSEPYQFEYKAVLTSNDFTHPQLQAMVEACNNATVHMHPDVATQLIETECFERMKGHVKRHIEGRSIKELMEMKNDLERMMLKDQLDARDTKISKLEAELKAFEAMVDSYEPPKAVDIKPTKKK